MLKYNPKSDLDSLGFNGELYEKIFDLEFVNVSGY